MVFPPNIPDNEIIELLREAGCQPKRFMHGELQTHVWYFAPDVVAKKAGLDMAYKLKKRYDNTITLKHGLANISDEDIDAELSRIVGEVSTGLAALGGEKKKGVK